MPLTVITLKNVPLSLRGDLTKWMQEIATGVYIGNFNAKIREELWNRISDSVGVGEATMSFSYRNEIGYKFETKNSQRKFIDFDGIPLVLISSEVSTVESSRKLGFSNASKFRKARRFSNSKKHHINHINSYVAIDIETDGLDETKNSIIEIGAVKIEKDKIFEFNRLIKYDKIIPEDIKKLTGISNELLTENSVPIRTGLIELLDFVGNLEIVGYGLDFDIKFLNSNLSKIGLPIIKNKKYDLIKFVKNEKLFLNNYKLQTVLKSYGINDNVPHRALEDAKLIFQLSTKVKKFVDIINRK
ncbi:MAG: type I-E CRISPR-associated endoribonuclease Cas2e [Peptoniphilaceae bacterium]|uniref:type I-E CRISPR-associated endoribonuclease Cas2e n=1 Tax=Parvimonas sp. TaxID=1944660 RepID=UPI0025F4FCF4|nr:type I-E CRISPR-associated endoribonuclease Cas2e [Parvimonas sp.]MCI5997627.1 type I-E CRISPR-associated endoribonuclease Cas2e [Parvimonas sp.]MDD7764914.1 type I-E CRISPR-associated endoribonuclease Cas2e [Peptoniphilaceae bacterium]MDY3051403.1 type I-E CRISPR-associated endoribonuclease Cas2e [Parvimonas sp.]